jgi:hypothetical protein
LKKDTNNLMMMGGYIASTAGRQTVEPWRSDSDQVEMHAAFLLDHLCGRTAECAKVAQRQANESSGGSGWRRYTESDGSGFGIHGFSPSHARPRRAATTRHVPCLEFIQRAARAYKNTVRHTAPLPTTALAFALPSIRGPRSTSTVSSSHSKLAAQQKPRSPTHPNPKRKPTGTMCGGAIISEFIPQRDARGRAGKRGLCAEDLWPQPGVGFDDVPAADGYELTGAASFPHDQGNNVVYFLARSAHSKVIQSMQR